MSEEINFILKKREKIRDLVLDRYLYLHNIRIFLKITLKNKIKLIFSVIRRIHTTHINFFSSFLFSFFMQNFYTMVQKESVRSHLAVSILFSSLIIFCVRVFDLNWIRHSKNSSQHFQFCSTDLALLLEI